MDKVNFRALVCKILEKSNNLKDFTTNVTDFLYNLFKVDGVGIRLKIGEEYPFFEYRGFSDDFLNHEKNRISFT